MLAHLHTELTHALPCADFLARTAIEAILLQEGSIGTAQRVAGQLGLGNRFRFERLLRRAGFPSLRRFAARAEIALWVSAAGQTGASLFSMAVRAHRHPSASACYRLFKDVTGWTWGRMRKRGSRWVEARIVRAVRRLPPKASRP